MSGISETPLDSYVINQTTMAVLSVEEGKRVYSKVIERETSFYVELKPLQIIERSCRFFGSSYAGRKAGTYEVTGISHKPPIVIDSSNHLYFFQPIHPTVLSAAGSLTNTFIPSRNHPSETRWSPLQMSKPSNLMSHINHLRVRCTEQHISEPNFKIVLMEVFLRNKNLCCIQRNNSSISFTILY